MHLLRALFVLATTLGIGITQEGEPERRVPELDPDAAPPATQIWAPHMLDQQRVYFRRRVQLPEGARGVRLVVSCDNEALVFVDGRRLLDCRTWEHLGLLDLEDIAAGEHVIAVRGTNTGGPAALVVWLLWEDADGVAHSLVSDATWRCSTEERRGWTTAEFDDTRWQAATTHGDTPFGKNVYGMNPADYLIADRFSDLERAIDKALADMRAAAARGKEPDDAALLALGEIERAVVKARQVIWDRRAAKARAKKD